MLFRSAILSHWIFRLRTRWLCSAANTTGTAETWLLFRFDCDGRIYFLSNDTDPAHVTMMCLRSVDGTHGLKQYRSLMTKISIIGSIKASWNRLEEESSCLLEKLLPLA